MKKITILIAMILVPVFAMAQSATIDKLIDKYSGQEGVTVVNISPDLFQIINSMNIKEVKDAEFPVDKLSTVKILSIESQEALKGTNFLAEVTADLNTNEFSEVMTVKDGAEDVRMWMKTAGQQIREFLLVVSSPDEGVVVYISGDFNMNDIQGLASSFGGMDGLKELETMEIH